MLYDTMKPEFILQLFTFGAFAVLFLLLSVYTVHTHHQLAYKKWAATLFFVICADFTVLFIRVTAPYEQQSHFLFFAFLTLAIITLSVLLIFIVYYTKEKKIAKKSPHFDILQYIDDYVLVFDENGEIILSSCPREMEKKVTFTKEVTTFEITFHENHYMVSLSPILRDNAFLGVVGILHDITTQSNLLMTLREKIKRLYEINENLLREVNVDDTLQIAQQRKQLTLDIQDEIDKKITILIQQITKIASDTTPEIRVQNLEFLGDSLRLILSDIRKIVYGR